MAWLCTRTTGVSFAMLTLAFAQLFYAVAYKWQSVTGGSDGLAGRAADGRPVRSPALRLARSGSTIWSRSASRRRTCSVARFVRLARGHHAAGHPRQRAEGARRSATTRARYKIAVFVLSAFFGGLAGALYAPFAGFASPDLFFWILSGQVLIMVIVGRRRHARRAAARRRGVLPVARALSERAHGVLGTRARASSSSPVVIFVPAGPLGLVRGAAARVRGSAMTAPYVECRAVAASSAASPRLDDVRLTRGERRRRSAP